MMQTLKLKRPKKKGYKMKKVRIVSADTVSDFTRNIATFEIVRA